MEGVIASFRRGRTTQKDRQMIIYIDSVKDRKAAEKLVGKKVSWEVPNSKKVIKGEISAAHGDKGAVRAIFETGMPGQSLGKKVKIE